MGWHHLVGTTLLLYGLINPVGFVPTYSHLVRQRLRIHNGWGMPHPARPPPPLGAAHSSGCTEDLSSHISGLILGEEHVKRRQFGGLARPPYRRIGAEHR